MQNSDFTILVVDDEKSILDLVSMLLEREGYRVLLAGHSDEALLKLDGFHQDVHLLLTDLRMDPYMDGFELAKCVRLLRPAISVLYISGFSENIMVNQEVAAGKAIFLAKPFSISELLEKIQSILKTTSHFRAYL
jgi:two-component system, cell cycle sensor histidine kinase and response regulator CckA